VIFQLSLYMIFITCETAWFSILLKDWG